MKNGFFLILLSFYACASPVSDTENAVDSTVSITQTTGTSPARKMKKVQGIKEQLIGVWTDGSTENATFVIGADSIFYMEAMTPYPYTLKGDSLTLMYPEMTFTGTVRVSGNTLVLTDPEVGLSRYTRFGN